MSDRVERQVVPHPRDRATSAQRTAVIVLGQIVVIAALLLIRSIVQSIVQGRSWRSQTGRAGRIVGDMADR